MVDRYTRGVPTNEKKACGSKSEAIAHFKAAWEAGRCAVVDMGDDKELKGE